MSYSRILGVYADTKDTELEFRFQIKSRDIFKKLISTIQGDKTIEQSINFISPGIDFTRICKLLFVNGKKKQSIFMSKSLLGKTPIIGGIIPYKLTVSSEKNIEKFNMDLSKFARIKLRFSVCPVEIEGWRVDFTLVRIVNNIKLDIKKDKTNMLFEIDAQNFVNDAPWDYANTLELEVEHISKNKDMKSGELDAVLEYIFSMVDVRHKNIVEYQKKIYQTASYIVDKRQLELFRQKKGIRDLYNRVWELNRASYYRDVYPNIRKYFLLHKADGIRSILIIEGNKLFSLDGLLTTFELKSSHDKPTIIDSEFVNGKFYAFDVIVFNGENVSKKPSSQRIAYIPKIVGMAEGHVAPKKIQPLSDNYRSEITEMYESSKNLPYGVDGLIFTPLDDTYANMKSWKWKPLEHMSIDFLVKKPPDKLLGISPYETRPDHTILFLFCGISKILYDKLRLTPVSGYKKMFPHQNMYRNFPIQFSPSDEPFAYIYYHPNDSELKIENITDNVCEFRRIDLDVMPKWDIMKIRTDRKTELDRGNYFGNGFYIAEYTWQNYQNPLKLEDLIISSSEFMDMGYFREEKAAKYKPVAGFNSFVKCQLLSKFRGSDWLVDLAAGKGQDMFRVSDAKISNALFLDNDPQALSELVSRKHDFQRGIKKLNTRIYTKLANLTTDYNKIIKFLKQIGIPTGTIDVSMCNFAIHYFMGTPDNVRNVIKLVYSLLKPGGHFFFTAFNGEKIFELLGDKQVWNSRDDTVLKYSIKKLYTSEMMSDTGQRIDVLLPFSGGRYYTEFLVNFKYLINEFESNNFVLEKTGDFHGFLPLFKKESNLYEKLSDHDIEFLSLYKYGMVRKKMTPRGRRLIELKQAEEDVTKLTKRENASVFNIDVQDPWFSFIKKGIKSVEGRLNKGKFQDMKAGDIVTWSNRGQYIDTYITDIVEYETFKEMLQEETLGATLPGVERIEEGVKTYHQFYNAEKEKEHGVLAIKIKLIK